MDNHELSVYLKRESSRVIDSTTIYGTILPLPMKLQSENILQEHARTWVRSSLLSQGLKMVSLESNIFTVFMNDLSLCRECVNDREKSIGRGRESSRVRSEKGQLNDVVIEDIDLITPADLLVKWVQAFDSTHSNFKVRYIIIYLLKIS